MSQIRNQIRRPATGSSTALAPFPAPAECPHAAPAPFPTPTPAPTKRPHAALASLLVLATATAVPPAPASAQPATPPMPVIQLVKDDSGTRLQVDGEDMMVLGVNWDYFPVGTTYSYSFWTEPDHIIEAALEREMSLLKAMGGNAIRAYVGITPKWVRHIYETYGIYTILNHALARYGVTVGGVFHPNTDYSDPRARAVVMAEIEDMVNAFRDTPGVLMWLLGNENNYGLVWSSAETEDLPEGEANEVRARYMYSLFGDVAEAHQGDRPHAPRRDGEWGPAIHRHHRRGGSRPGRLRHQRVPGHLLRAALPGGARKARPPGHVHRVRRRRVGCEEHARGPGRPGEVPDRAVARDLRAVGGEGPRGQLDRGPHLPVVGRLVEVRPGIPPGHPGHERVVGQRRLPRGLRRGRQQHERGVVGDRRQGSPPTTTTSSSSTRGLPGTHSRRPTHSTPTLPAPTSRPSASTSPPFSRPTWRCGHRATAPRCWPAPATAST